MLSELINDGGFFGMLFIACAMFYVATRIMSQCHEDKDPRLNILLELIALTFFASGVTFMFFAKMQIQPGEENGGKPQVQVDKIDPAVTIPIQEDDQAKKVEH